ncbi:MAG: hypothetical protein A2Z02_02215 [Chloroflexi bacterium RBG_16_48_7]|nr:MAG: hypothetical protein A2Z02_02215 [Chloroflexi bacterium RBG_16_48_7]
MNTTDFLTVTAAICPERDAIIFEGTHISYAQLQDNVNKLANSLKSLGLQKNDVVAMLQVNCPECLETYFACAKLNLIYLPLNFRVREEELHHLLNHAEAKALFLGTRYEDPVNKILPGLPSIKHVITLDVRRAGMLFYKDMVGSFANDEVITNIDDDDITILMYTAGTTGLPKGVPLRHSGFVSYVLDNVEPVNPDISEANVLTVPLYHVAGIQAVMAGIYGGRTLVLMRQFNVTEWMQTVERERVNRAMLVPTMLKYIVENPDYNKYDLSSLKVITYGAAPMPFDVISKALKLMPRVKFINAFGQTETASTISALGPEDHIIEGTEAEKEKKIRRLTQSIGKALPDVRVKIVNEDGEDLPVGQVGEIVAKGARIMNGYWRDDEKTRQSFTRDGWLITRDRGWIDEDDYIYLMGRGDDIIIRGGENIAPGEIENALTSHPKVEEAAVIGVGDAEWGQVPIAVVTLKKGQKASSEELIEHCHKILASFKRPKRVIIVDELPRNAMGKLLKNKLREQFGNS